jgi:prolipoprotein diacylglyceryltransferase
MGMTLSLPMIVAGIWFIWRANAEPPLGTRAVDKAPAKQG